ncbi:penicillin-binding protein 1C [Rhizobiaceae bacterium BDR2-2]|uniref:peptidoglycan glycosyltransferase n=1 Tax=Ectorhizobium quercum TaxID=2965071 RepID=A0AAE3N3N6_9HYPH|nr:penicillin-binding protein 1C [Ectorhizobium quercum]MCX8999357.1 penicillin-binding protein 1C [Ectorhizobium quercum]
MKGVRRAAFTLAGLGLLAAVAAVALDRADRAFPPPLEEARAVSAEVLDRNGALLRAFATQEGRWRLKTQGADVDPRLVEMLIAYEDRRFYAHGGVDPWAVARAAGQFLTHGRIVSGASTLSMQVARLIEPRAERSLLSKLRQMARAVQIERRLGKADILDLYLTLAPYGGNLEGVRAASLAWFGKEPKRLSVAEAALLVALPQLPERRRPDRFPDAAMKARERVIERAVQAGALDAGEAARAELAAVPSARRALPSLAAHLAGTARIRKPQERLHRTTIDARVQAGLETVAAGAAQRLGPGLSIAMIMADARTGDILGRVGSADYFDGSRRGWIDMTEAVRSPGSALKPFIYALAFEEGLVAQETIVEDRPSDFSGYRPRNFDTTYQGDVSIRRALQLSLNVPAVKLLDATGPARLMVRLRRAGVTLHLPAGEPAGLSIALGGAGISLKDLVQLYTAFPNRGKPMRLGDGVTGSPGPFDGEPLTTPSAAWQVADILASVLPPPGSPIGGIAYKTGTSYGYRDAWSVGFDGRHVLGVWVGRADNGAVPGLTGYQAAAPILFEAFARSGVAVSRLPEAPVGAARPALAELPFALRRFAATESGLPRFRAAEAPPRIVYPPEGARVELGLASEGRVQPLALKLQGGTAPFRWLANGRPLSADPTRRRTGEWLPDGGGFSRLTVIDANGRAASVGVFLE